MASEAHNAKKQKVLHIEGRPVDLPRKRVSSSTKKIMKEVRYFCLPVKLKLIFKQKFTVLPSLDLET